jgi:hypothetical protein
MHGDGLYEVVLLKGNPMKRIVTLLAVSLFVAGIGFAQTDTTKHGGFSEKNAVTGFAAINGALYEVVYGIGVLPIVGGSPLPDQPPDSENVIISFIPYSYGSDSGFMAGIDALPGDSLGRGGTVGGVWEYSFINGWKKIGRPLGTKANGLPSHSVVAMAWDGLWAYAAMPGNDLKSQSPAPGGVYLASPTVSGWSPCYNGPVMNDSSFVTSFFVDGTTVYAGLLSHHMQNMGLGFGKDKGFGPGGIVRSTDRGLTWVDISPADTASRDVKSIIKVGSSLYISTLFNGVLRSTDDGTIWTPIPFSDITNPVMCFATDGTTLYAGTSWNNPIVSNAQGGVFQLQGTTWSKLSVPLPDSTGVSALYVFGTNLYIGTGMLFGMPSKESGYFVVPLSSSGVGASANDPLTFKLDQNYPNPFNPATLIRYTIAGSRENGVGSTEVRLVVYDILGREVAVLVNEKKAAGSYSVKFDASGLASGVYFYRLQAGNFAETKKLLLIR